MGTHARLLAVDGRQPPPPMTSDEQRTSEELLRKVDEAVATLRREAMGLENAREQYRRRQEGMRGRR